MATLQWGHASTGVESGCQRAKAVVEGIASMGPRLNRRGKPAFLVQRKETRKLLQWGHASTGVERMSR